MASSPKNVTVIGCGFAGLTAIRKLRALDRNLTINVINKKPEFVFFPSLIWVPSGLRSGKDITVSLQGFFLRMQVNFIPDQVTGLSEDGRTVTTSRNRVHNDGLIIASGGRFIKKLPGIEHAITPCEGIPAAMKIKQRLASLQSGTIAVGFAGNPKEPSAMRGGPMFEFLFGLDTQLRREKRRDKFKLVFFSPAKKPGARLGEKAVDRLLEVMRKRGIETHLGHKMKRIEPYKVVTEGGELDADLILFMPGMTGNQWCDNTNLPRSEGGLIKADQHCKVADFEHVYVAGDSGSFPGPDWLPKQAHMADLQAATAAQNLLLGLNGESADKTFRTELVCIVDSQNSGFLVVRTPKSSIVLPSSLLLHWAKRFFEWSYLLKYR